MFLHLRISRYRGKITVTFDLLVYPIDASRISFTCTTWQFTINGTLSPINGEEYQGSIFPTPGCSIFLIYIY